MKRVASLYLPDWSIDRLRRAGRIAARPDLGTAAVAALSPGGDGWRPGARWARSFHSSSAGGGGPPAQPVVEGLGARRTGNALQASPPLRGPPPRTGEELVVTSIREGSKVVIAAVSPAARAIGLTPGMAVTQARAQVPDIIIEPADPAGDLAALRQLALAAARRWSPLTALSGDDGLFLDITGTAHLFGGEARMARRIVRLLARLGFTARIAITDTAGAAWALARYGRAADGILICPAGEQEAALATLPIAALRADPAAIELLRRLGIEHIAQLVAMPRAPLARRFGAALVTRLDQALGQRDEPLDPVIPTTAIAVIQRFAEPIATAEAIEHWLGALIPQLVTALAEAGLGARVIELVAERIDGIPQRLRIGLARPSRDGAHLLRLMVRRIEEIAPGFGIDALGLHVRRTDPLDAQPFAERLEERSTDLAPLVDVLANRIGERRLWRSRPIESEVPERCVATVPPLDPPAQDMSRRKIDDVRQLDRSPELHPWHHRWPRPIRLLRRPEQLDHVIAELPDQPPRRFSWRGEMHRVVRADGPERVQGEWWRRASERHGVRDYFQVEDETGQRFWLFRRGDGERGETGDLAWFMHGAFG